MPPKPATPASSDCLSCIGRKSFVSQSALAKVLQELKELPELPDATSRTTLKRSRDRWTDSCKTPFGPVLQNIDFQKAHGSGTVSTQILHPAALLHHAAEHCAPFGKLLAERLQQVPPTLENPWGLVWYSDEVSPGNQLRHVNSRKVQVVYWSFSQFTARELSCENLWFTLVALRSSLVQQLGGMTALWRQLAHLFFENPDFRRGLCLRVGNESRLLFSDLNILIADESAIKHSLANKGASGIVMCVACQNIYDSKSSIASHGHENDLVSSLETDISKFRKHTPASIRATMTYLEEQSANLTAAQFDKVQSALGFNYRPDGLLAHPAYGPPIIDAVMYDWMHIYMVTGVFNLLTGFFLGDLHDHGFTAETIETFFKQFTWPARTRGAAPKDALQKRSKKDGPLKCGASEGLNFYIVLRVYVILMVMPTANEQLIKSCEAWLALCAVLDALMAIAKGRTTPAQLQRLIRSHLEKAKELYGEGWWVPKCHLALHLPLQFHAHGCLLSCFTHERKHKIIKKIASNIADTSRAFEKSILDDVLYGQLDNLATKAFVPGHQVHLIQPVRAAPRALQTVVQSVLRTEEPVYTASQAIHGGNFAVSAKDVAVLALEGVTHVGRVGYHVAVGESCWTHITFWTHVHGCMYRISDEAVLVKTSCLQDTCPFSVQGSDAIVVLPS